MNEAPSNNQPVNQAALKWLKEAKASPAQGVSYVAQLADWGLAKGLVTVQRPMSPSQPDRDEVVETVSALLGWGSKEAAFATEWFLSNPNLSKEEQEQNLEQQLRDAENPSEAAQIAVETAYRVMVADSATSPA